MPAPPDKLPIASFLRRLSKFVRLFFFLPLFLILMVTIPLMVAYANVSDLYRLLLVKIQMIKNRRSVSVGTLKHRLASGMSPGMFILEAYTLGWGVGRVWWTPDTLPIEDPPPNPDRTKIHLEDEFNPHHEWLHDTYTDLKTGKALLLMSRAQKKIPQKLQITFPAIPQTYLWTGMIEMQRLYQSKQHKP